MWLLSRVDILSTFPVLEDETPNRPKDIRAAQYVKKKNGDDSTNASAQVHCQSYVSLIECDCGLLPSLSLI